MPAAAAGRRGRHLFGCRARATGLAARRLGGHPASNRFETWRPRATESGGETRLAALRRTARTCSTPRRPGAAGAELWLELGADVLVESGCAWLGPAARVAGRPRQRAGPARRRASRSSGSRRTQPQRLLPRARHRRPGLRACSSPRPACSGAARRRARARGARRAAAAHAWRSRAAHDAARRPRCRRGRAALEGDVRASGRAAPGSARLLPRVARRLRVTPPAAWPSFEAGTGRGPARRTGSSFDGRRCYGHGAIEPHGFEGRLTTAEGAPVDPGLTAAAGSREHGPRPPANTSRCASRRWRTPRVRARPPATTALTADANFLFARIPPFPSASGSRRRLGPRLQARRRRSAEHVVGTCWPGAAEPEPRCRGSASARPRSAAHRRHGATAAAQAAVSQESCSDRVREGIDASAPSPTSSSAARATLALDVRVGRRRARPRMERSVDRGRDRGRRAAFNAIWADLGRLPVRRASDRCSRPRRRGALAGHRPYPRRDQSR